MPIVDPEELRVECDRCGESEMFPTHRYSVHPTAEAFGVSASSLEEEGWVRLSNREILCFACWGEQQEEEAEEDDSRDDDDMGGES